jgi:hypothetical protein
MVVLLLDVGWREVMLSHAWDVLKDLGLWKESTLLGTHKNFYAVACSSSPSSWHVNIPHDIIVS